MSESEPPAPAVTTAQQSTNSFRNGFFGCLGVGVAIALVLFVGGGLNRCAATSPTAAAEGAAITLDEFNQLKPGMTYQQVSQVFGSPGTLQSQTAIDGLGTSETYIWQNAPFVSAIVMFQDAKLVSKSQLGLN